jgi:hypothetical protein
MVGLGRPPVDDEMVPAARVGLVLVGQVEERAEAAAAVPVGVEAFEVAAVAAKSAGEPGALVCQPLGLSQQASARVVQPPRGRARSGRPCEGAVGRGMGG